MAGIWTSAEAGYLDGRTTGKGQADLQAIPISIDQGSGNRPAKFRSQGPTPRQLTALGCLLIVVIGAVMRIAGTDWDTGSNLHPDERHMMFVLTDTLSELREAEPDASLTEQWFATGQSPLDPRRNGQLYVYGELPHLVTVIAAQLTGTEGWPPLLRLGRTLGAILDSYTILAVFLLAVLTLRNAPAALVAAACYAFCPLALQLSNFFAVDVWLASASAWCAVAATRMLRAPDRGAALGWAALAGTLAGLGLACKLPGILLGGVVGLAVLLRFWSERGSGRLLLLLGGTIVSLLSMAIAFRLTSPFTFEGPSPFGLTLTPRVLEGYLEMARLVGDSGFPPNWQWMAGYGPLDAFADLLVWGLGPVTGLAVLAGAAVLAMRPMSLAMLPLLLLVAAFLLYWLGGPAPALRYALPAVPVLCVIAGATALAAPRSAMVGAVALVFFWGTGMVALHTGTNSRVAASQWLWANLPEGTVIATESAWDDGLPVAIRRNAAGDLLYPEQDGHFSSVRLGLEVPDSIEKAKAIALRLAEADVLVVSSERMRGPILALPERFPMSGAYYRLLASGELCFEKVYENRPGYRVLGVRFDDAAAQEPWSVYDHPDVEIYRRGDCYDAQALEAQLIGALDRGS